MKTCCKYLLMLCWLLDSGKVSAQEEKRIQAEAGGYLKDLQSVFFTDNTDSLITSNLIHNRINLKITVMKNFFARLEIRNRLFYGEQVKLIPGFGKVVSSDEGYFNLTRLWADEKSLAGVSTLDRALICFSPSRFRVTLGRQRINWGINSVWNPNDLFNAFNILDYDYEERPGNDAIRLQYFPELLTSVEMAFKPGRRKNQSVAAALLKFNKWRYDFQFFAGLCREDITGGAGWAGHIREAGFKGEVSWFRKREGFSKNRGSVTASITVDYTFKNNWYASGSALYVQDPFPVLQGMSSAFPVSLSAKALMPFRWSVYGGIIKSFNTILSGSIAAIYSPQQHNTIFLPSLSLNIAQNADLDLTVQSFFSEQGGKFNTAGNSAFLRFKWSF